MRRHTRRSRLFVLAKHLCQSPSAILIAHTPGHTFIVVVMPIAYNLSTGILLNIKKVCKK